MTDMFLYPGEASPNDVKLTDPTVLNSSGSIVLAQFAAVCLAVASVTATLVKSGAVASSCVASVVAASEMKYKGVAASNVLANAAVVGKLFLGGKFSALCAASVVVSSEKIQRSAIDVALQALALIGAELRASGVIINLGSTLAAADPQVNFKGDIQTWIDVGAVARGAVISLVALAIEQTTSKGFSPRSLGGISNKVLKSVWHDAALNDEEEKKRALVAVGEGE